ncbi:hypothetical protein [Streptomyces sp. SID11385]|uniref:helix-turn-helix domain-containing protein n=1 Tax=Streptomyces sp. SID11385 TaxID=2706031 RepID=UPI0013CC2960|nr:hypothetical protein [Streptomyces sp. SID11385]NEA40905.1 hypothetical protein [Streptomyces sp. SID11385]
MNFRFVGAERAAAHKRATDLYVRDGLGLRTVAQQLGVSFGLARRLLLEAGVELRPRGRHRPG